jgi:hypothetical protein
MIPALHINTSSFFSFLPLAMQTLDAPIKLVGGPLYTLQIGQVKL